MPLVTLRRFTPAAAALAFLCVLAAWDQSAQAGGPLLVGSPALGASGVAFVWNPAAGVTYSTDQGPLGALTNDNTATSPANTLVKEAFDVWQAVPTATIGFSRFGDLGADVVGGASDPNATPPKVNQMEFFNAFINNCNTPVAPAPADTQNVVVYDTDGSITNGILGSGQSSVVIGFAGAVCISTVGGNKLTRGRAVLNGRFVDNMPGPADLEAFPTVDKFREVITHEFGHLIGLDHSQVNEDIFNGMTDNDTLFGLPVMFPVIFRNSPSRLSLGFPLLAPDDEAWVSNLYRTPSFSSTFGFIEGRVFFSDGQTPVQGTNLVARLQDDPATPFPPCVNESRCFAYSSTSGFRFTGNPGQSATAAYLPCTPSGDPACTNGFFGNNEAGSIFGSRDPTLIGFYQIPMKIMPVPPETTATTARFTVQVEAIDPDWTQGSRVGPLGASDGAAEQFPLPGNTPEFWDAAESATDNPATSSPVTVSVSSTVTDINIILNGTPPRFDSFESARLRWLEPAPAWLRERRPPAFLVNG